MGKFSAALLAVAAAAVLFSVSEARLHHLTLNNDARQFFPISTFGFYSGGYLHVNVTNFRAPRRKESDTLGFTIHRTTNDALNRYAETSEARCILNSELPSGTQKDAILRFVLDFEKGVTRVGCSDNIQSLAVFPGNGDWEAKIKARSGASGDASSDSALFQSVAKKMQKRDAAVAAAKSKKNSNATTGSECEKVKIDLDKTKGKDGGPDVFNTSFAIYIDDEKQEGLYSLYFHNCHNYGRAHELGNDDDEDDGEIKFLRVSFRAEVTERNRGGYLSAGEMPLPALYILMAVLFFLSGCFWVFILRKNGSQHVFRIHWIMAALCFLKSLSLFFHGVNYHKIETHGYHIESWAVLYYVTHLLKGGLLFFTIVLIGSGWAFIKHVLSDKEKRVFMIVLPLQVIANVAYIIIEESEEGEARHNWWKEIFILVDLVCCALILFPVVWSIRHLQDASRTDGKASISLEKLKLFRHFYIMVVCYIYFTRIIVYLLKITVPFQYEWLDEMFKEMATFVFYVMTGYKFRPASNNPYFSVPTEDDYDMEEVLIGSTAINEQVTNRKKRVLVDDEDSEDDEGMVYFPGNAGNSSGGAGIGPRTESSHDLD